MQSKLLELKFFPSYFCILTPLSFHERFVLLSRAELWVSLRFMAYHSAAEAHMLVK
jgi:hypothetical protein